jgi:hypothetical protein
MHSRKSIRLLTDPVTVLFDLVVQVPTISAGYVCAVDKPVRALNPTASE